MHRRTHVVSARLAYRAAVLRAAEARDHGLRVTTLSGLASRLAGPFLRVADTVDVRRALATVPASTLGDLSGIADLPGFDRAASGTLRASWSAGLDLADHAKRGGRWAEMAALDAAVRDALPTGARPTDEIVHRAIQRAHHAPAVLGAVTLVRTDHVSPVYRPLLSELARHVTVRWKGQHAHAPAWLPDAVEYGAPNATSPRLARVACADPRHEVVEAFRWARRLMAEDGVPPGDIAIAAASVEAYDDAVLALADDAQLPLHAAAGLPALAGPDGQAAAALADLLLRGLDQARVRRFVATARRPGAGSRALRDLPSDWPRVLPDDAPLATLPRWQRALADRSDDHDPVRSVLRELGADVARGTDAARETGARWLQGRARRLWRRALDEGPASALDATLESARLADEVDPAGAIVWAPAAELATAPRRHVRLLGLASRSWPRGAREDPLLPDHVLDGTALHDRTVTEADRSAFAAILASAETSVVLSRPRRDEGARRKAPSPLLRGLDAGDETVHAPRRLPEHAYSEADRRLARPAGLEADPHADRANAAWHAWYADEATPHDGALRPDHPGVLRALGRAHSATSLRKALRDGQAFVWTYALGWREKRDPERALALDALERGSLLHDVLERAVASLEAEGGLAAASSSDLERAVATAVRESATAWEVARPVPPGVLWRGALAEAERDALTALRMPLPTLANQRSYVEAPFGLSPAQAAHETRSTDAAPWPIDATVRLAGRELRIMGRIDRLDLSGDRRDARVIDYKSSRKVRKPKDRAVDVDEGRELQRCLYAYAVRDRLQEVRHIDAVLVYPTAGVQRPMRDPDATLEGLAHAIDAAFDVLRSGRALPGPDAFEEWNDLRLALPADVARGYRARKEAAFVAARAAVDAILLAEPGEEPWREGP